MHPMHVYCFYTIARKFIGMYYHYTTALDDTKIARLGQLVLLGGGSYSFLIESLYALNTSYDFVALRILCFLQVWVFARPVGWVPVAAKLNAVSNHL